MKTITSIFVLFIALNSDAQLDSLKNLDYSLADSIALNFPKKRYKSNEELAHKLTRNLTSETDKFRVIYRWISNNIEYQLYKYGKDPDKVLKRKKAVCEGYAHLLKAMCEAEGIACEVVTGHSKTQANSNIGKPLKETTHAWNAVKLQGKWYLTDLTWASGSFNRKKRKFIKDFDEVYFLADPDFFVLNHYPEDEKWLLTETDYSKRTFKKSPIYFSGYYSQGISLIDPPKGKVKRELELTFTSSENIDRIAILFEGEEYSQEIDFKKEGNTYSISHPFDKKVQGEFFIFINLKAVMSFLKK